jgi:hypothetical protein
MANGDDHQRYLRGLPLFGPLASLIYRQYTTIFFIVPFTLLLCFFYWNLFNKTGSSTLKLCIYLRCVVVMQALLWILHLLPYTLLKTYAHLSGICFNACCASLLSVIGPLSRWFGSSLFSLFQSFTRILLTALCIWVVKSPASKVKV